MEHETGQALLGREWSALHADAERAERATLWLKLAAVALCALAPTLGLGLLPSLLLIAVLWLQEAIVRTGQARLVTRLLDIESLLGAHGPAGAGCQLYTRWQAARAGTAGLVREYLRHALRPTVAFPYAPLLVLCWYALAIE